MSEFTKFITPRPVRVSYVHLFQPWAGEGMGTPKYTATLLIPKTDTEMIQQIMQAFEAARQEAASPTGCWKGVVPPQPPMTLYDGDAQKASGDSWGEECKGHYVLRTGSTQAPQVVDQYGKKILDASKVYSGCWCYVSVNMFGYSSNGNRGLSAGLNNVMFAKDDEPFGAVSNPNVDFAQFIQQGQPAMGMPAPQGYAPQMAAPQPQGYAPSTQMAPAPQMPQQQIAPPQQGNAFYGVPGSIPAGLPQGYAPAPGTPGFAGIPGIQEQLPFNPQ